MQERYRTEAESFRKNFSKYKHKKIVIYGIGRRTATLLPQIGDFNIIGLLDRDEKKIGRIINNVKIISLEEAKNTADIIIINSDPSNYNVIYKRIAHIGIKIYYVNGEIAVEIKKRNKYENNEYWSTIYEDVIEKIEHCDVVSFDIFDTLVMRKLYQPQDIFVLLEKKVDQYLGYKTFFAEKRQLAVALVRKNEPDLNDIYRVLGKELNLSSSVCEKIKQIELEIEIQCCIAREKIKKLYEYAYQLGKEVYLISDMYIRSVDLQKILFHCGISIVPKDHIWVSCEKRASKQTGEMWKLWKRFIGKEKRLLHIGDNKIGDIREAEKYGIDTFYIMSGRDMLNSSSISGLAPLALSFNDSIHMGLVIAELFNDPFVLSKSKGKARIYKRETFGYCAYGAAILKFLMWLIDQARKNQNDRLLFFARDGYFLIRFYNYIKEIYFRGELPEAIYVPMSRRLIFMVTMDMENTEDFDRVVGFPYIGTFADYLQSRFHVNAMKDTETINHKVISASNEKENIKIWLKPYLSEIRSEVQKERESYICYLKKAGVLNALKKDGIVDLGYYGTNQFFFQRLIQKKVDGYYFYAYFLQDNVYLKECKINSCFNDENDLSAENSPIKRKSAFLESFLTAPYGMIRCISQEGELECEEDKKNQHHFDIKKDMSEGVMRYFIDFLKLSEFPYHQSELPEQIFYEIVNGDTMLTDDILEGLYFDNDMVGSSEVRMEI